MSNCNNDPIYVLQSLPNIDTMRCRTSRNNIGLLSTWYQMHVGILPPFLTAYNSTLAETYFEAKNTFEYTK